MVLGDVGEVAVAAFAGREASCTINTFLMMRFRTVRSLTLKRVPHWQPIGLVNVSAVCAHRGLRKAYDLVRHGFGNRPRSAPRCAPLAEPDLEGFLRRDLPAGPKIARTLRDYFQDVRHRTIQAVRDDGLERTLAELPPKLLKDYPTWAHQQYAALAVRYFAGA